MGFELEGTQAASPVLVLEGAGGIEELGTVGTYDITEDREEMNRTLVNSKEVDDLCSQIVADDLSTIVRFGAEAAEEISKTSDIVLKSMSQSQLDDSNELMKTLAQIMSKFNIEEIKDNPSFFAKIFGNSKKSLEKIVDKYHDMGDQVDRIYVQLRGFEDEIAQSNRKLDALFEANVEYYHRLVKYILAGEQGCRELEAYIKQRTADMERTGDQSIQFELTTLDQALKMLEQRTQDLRTAECVAMQSIPMIKMMVYTNYNLVRKINSAFIVTLPVFKQALAQAILLKRQRMQAEAMSELDKKTNEMIRKNAANASEIMKKTAGMTSGSAIQIETLETAWKTITSGIGETQKLQLEAKQKRTEEQKRLESVRADFERTK